MKEKELEILQEGFQEQFRKENLGRCFDLEIERQIKSRAAMKELTKLFAKLVRVKEMSEIINKEKAAMDKVFTLAKDMASSGMDLVHNIRLVESVVLRDILFEVLKKRESKMKVEETLLLEAHEKYATRYIRYIAEKIEDCNEFLKNAEGRDDLLRVNKQNVEVKLNVLKNEMRKYNNDDYQSTLDKLEKKNVFLSSLQGLDDVEEFVTIDAGPMLSLNVANRIVNEILSVEA